MSLLNSHFWKFFVGLILVIIVGIGAVYGIDYYEKYKAASAERRALSEFDALKKQYAEDTYGGKTPEETLALFIDALKKGDTDLAAKYVLIDDQEKVRADLLRAKTVGKLNDVIERVKSLRQSRIENNYASFVITNETRVIQYQVSLSKNNNGIWKISEL